MDGAKLLCLAAALAGAADRRAEAGMRTPIGWRNVGGMPQVVAYDGPGGAVEVAYRFDRSGKLASWAVRSEDRDDAGVPGAFAATDPDAHPPVTLVSATPEQVSLEV